ncbi:MAG: hypothetical protein J5I98_00880 [Phaeodactylibacter sp.]|nr:hypothetical protein [Phaeodactylibacter sp.]
MGKLNAMQWEALAGHAGTAGKKAFQMLKAPNEEVQMWDKCNNDARRDKFHKPIATCPEIRVLRRHQSLSKCKITKFAPIS